MKRCISVLLLLALLASTILSVCSCGQEVTAEKGTVTRVTVDINPSVEIMVNDENKVVSVTALNDDGSILIAGEVIVGMTYDEAVAKIVELADSVGYIPHDSEEAKPITITVSGESKYAEHVKEQAKKAAQKFCDEHDIKGKVELAKSIEIAELRKMAVNTGLVTEEQAAGLNEQQLMAVLSESRIETALLLTEEMREAYYRAKEHRIELAQRESTVAVIQAMGGLYSIALTGYQVALKAYSEAITALDNFRYETFVSPESEYQKTLVKLEEQKAEILQEKSLALKLDVNGEEYAALTVKIQASEKDYDAAVAAFKELGTKCNEALEKLVATLREAEKALTDLEEKFPQEINSQLEAKATEIENKVNEAKDGFFASFEQAHKADIDKSVEQLQAMKEARRQAYTQPAETTAA